MTVNTLMNTNSKMTEQDPRAPMAPAPMVYNPDNSVAWDRMWDNFCVLASAGGPPHRATLLRAQTDANPDSVGYRFACEEIIRGIALVSGLQAAPAQTGWIAIECGKASRARWLSEQINQENVEAYAEETRVFVPVGDNFALKGEIKNVITAVAKTTHYWRDHLATEIKTSLEWEERFKKLARRFFRR
ncbi:MAG: hypothetical protein NT075_15405 [Chloroflexi bacterium]|nr:hypothetical protein [Chloroflexota bacterium]